MDLEKRKHAENGKGEVKPQRGLNVFQYTFCVIQQGHPKGLGTIHSLIEIVSSSYDFEMTYFPKKNKNRFFTLF